MPLPLPGGLAPPPLFNLARWGSMVCCLFSMHWGVVAHIEMLYYSLLDFVLRCSYCVTTTCAVHRRDPDRDFQAGQRGLCLLRLTALSAYYHYSALVCAVVMICISTHYRIDMP